MKSISLYCVFTIYTAESVDLQTYCAITIFSYTVMETLLPVDLRRNSGIPLAHAVVLFTYACIYWLT